MISDGSIFHMSLMGHLTTSDSLRVMSGHPPGTDTDHPTRHVRFVPISEVAVGSGHFRFAPESGNENEVWKIDTPVSVALACPKEIRNRTNLCCELTLSPFIFLNYTKMAKYEALEKNAVSEPEMAQLDDL